MMRKVFTFKVISFILAMCLITGCTANGSAGDGLSNDDVKAGASEDTGKVLNIYCWNDEFKKRIEAYYDAYDESTHMINDVKVVWNIIPNENNSYQQALDNVLENTESFDADERADIFLVEADNAKKYTNESSGYTEDISKIGITADDLSEQFAYTKDVVSDNTGAQKGISWQACPGVMIYRRDIAKAVFGTDNPDEIQKKVSDWDSFDQSAATMAASGYKMLGGYDDTYRAFSNNVSSPWVDENNSIVIDPSIEQWVRQTKTFTQNKDNAPYQLWSTEWGAGANSSGKVFCYFGPAWFIDYSLNGYSLDVPLEDGGKAEVGNGTYGDWAICLGPQSYYWGGSWICAVKDGDNTSIVTDIMRTLCCSEKTAESMAKDVNEFANNRAAMKKLAEDDSFGSEFLGGQNVYGIMCDSADAIKMENLSPYDQGLNESFQQEYHEYFGGDISEQEAYDNFIEAALKKYPQLNDGAKQTTENEKE